MSGQSQELFSTLRNHQLSKKFTNEQKFQKKFIIFGKKVQNSNTPELLAKFFLTRNTKASCFKSFYHSQK